MRRSRCSGTAGFDYFISVNKMDFWAVVRGEKIEDAVLT